MKTIISKSSQEIYRKEKFVLNYYTQKSLKGFMTARKWFNKLRNLVLVKKLNNNIHKSEEEIDVKKYRRLECKEVCNETIKKNNLEQKIENLREVRNKKRLAPKTNKY